MQPFEGYDAPMFIIDLTVVLQFTLLTKRALKSVELNKLYLLFFGLIFNILLTIVLNLKIVSPINDLAN